MTMNENNPLRQFFRRPAVSISLPSGGESYSPADIQWPDETKELPVFPMTAIDEITTKTPDALFNGSAMVEIIKSCIPAIKNPWALLSTDLDTVLISIKAAGGQETIDVESKCEKCEEEGTYGINLQVLLGSLQAGDFHVPVKIGELEVYFSPLTYRRMNEAALAQFEIQAKYKDITKIEDTAERINQSQAALVDVTALTMKILSQAIVKVVTPETEVTEFDHIHDFLKNADTKTYETVRDYNTELREKSTIKPLTIVCTSGADDPEKEECGHEYTQPFTLNASDFFG
jgi:hypothetical protein|tara:strand:- start:100 stop:963 length:864 start_codon:yes stop_codon:yes gene_type:complete